RAGTGRRPALACGHAPRPDPVPGRTEPWLPPASSHRWRSSTVKVTARGHHTGRVVTQLAAASRAWAGTRLPCSRGSRSARPDGRVLGVSVLLGSRTVTSSRSPGLAPTGDLPGTDPDTATTPGGSPHAHPQN